MSEAELRDWLINQIERENQNMMNCKDQNTPYFGMCMGAAEAYAYVLQVLDD